MKNLVYMAVTTDKYELPLALFENWREACNWSGKSRKCFNAAVCRKSIDRKNKCKYVSVRFIENE